MGTVTSRYNRQISREEQMIYDHLLSVIEEEAPEQMIERFRNLFIDGTRYSVPDIAEALDAVIASTSAQNEFRYVLNRCCHILINRWQAHPQYRLEIPRLIHLFETVSATSAFGHRRYRFNHRLVTLVKHFRDTEHYLVLRRLAQVLSRVAEESEGNRQLGTLIRRYPFLYEHCLLSDDHIHEQQCTVRQLQYEVQHQFELDLSKYVTYQIRKERFAHISNPQSTQHFIRPVPNPTLLSDGMLNYAIKHYSGRIDGNRTYRDLANNFIIQSAHSQNFGAFKDDLYQYIISGVDGAYGKRKFNHQLYNHLKIIFPESDSKPLNDFLIVRTCSQLFNFLVVDGPKSAQHFVFVDLLTNLGPILTTGLLLRILLLCSKVTPYLERRFSILFSHYESYSRDAVEWLISALETLNVALATNFGKVHLSTVA